MKNNKKGFTLVELLAVIVILGVLLVIAVPAVTNIQTVSKQKAAKDGALMLVKAIETYQAMGTGAIGDYYEGTMSASDCTAGSDSCAYYNGSNKYTYCLSGYCMTGNPAEKGKLQAYDASSLTKTAIATIS